MRFPRRRDRAGDAFRNRIAFFDSSETPWSYEQWDDDVALRRTARLRPGMTSGELVRFAREHFSCSFGDRVAALCDARAAYGGRRLRRSSLRSTLTFLTEHGWVLPDLLLVPNGNVQAQWRSADRRVVAQFLPTGEIWFTVIDGGRPRLTGQEMPAEFVAHVAPIVVTIS